MEINNLLEDARGTHKVMLEDSAKLATKWQASGLLEGLEGKKASNMAVILENQAKQVVAEANTNTQGGASFTAGSGENWAGVALPLVKSICSNRCSRFRICSANVTSFRSSILSRF